MQSPILKRFVIPVVFWGASVGSALSACVGDRISVRGDWGHVEFRIEIADDHQERARGLMHVEQLPRLSGMLFVYERPDNLSFWMRNTLIPLDMIFIRPTGEIAHIHENAIPLDETPIAGGDGNIAVLEINGGLARTFGISVGDEVRHPAFDDEIAAWPCGS